MTLADVIQIVERVASVQPSVNMIVRNNLEKLNTVPVDKYGAFVWQQGVHSGSVTAEGRDYSFVFYYTDRLTDDESNEIEVQSVGVETLSNILRKLYEEFRIRVADYQITPFHHKFIDLCAGAFVEVTLTAPVGTECGECYLPEMRDKKIKII